jgi:hypothetical protein
MSAAAKVIERVQAFDEAASYEALQSLKTAYHRFAARKQPDEARTVLLEGALLMLARREVTCATELGRMLVNSLTTAAKGAGGSKTAGAGSAAAAGGARAAADAAAAAEGLCRVLAGFAALPATAAGTPAAAVDAQVDEVGRFATEAVKWAQRCVFDRREGDAGHRRGPLAPSSRSKRNPRPAPPPLKKPNNNPTPNKQTGPTSPRRPSRACTTCTPGT